MKELLKLFVLILVIFEMKKNETSAISINKIDNMILNKPLDDLGLLLKALKCFNQNKNSLKTESELRKKFFKDFSKSNKTLNLNHLNEDYSLVLNISQRVKKY